MPIESIGHVQHELALFSKLYDLPDYVKQADMLDTISPANLPVTACADVRNNTLPLHTKAATYYSWLRYLNKQAEISAKFRPHIEERLTKQAAFWGIDADVAALKKRHDELHKAAELPDSAFALVWAGEDGRKERHYRISNPLEVKAACQAFTEFRDQFGFRDRQTIAKKILAKSAEFGVGLDDDLRETLEKQAGMGLYDPKACAKAICDRVNMVLPEIREEVRDGMRKTAAQVAVNPSLAMDPVNCESLCETLDAFDRMAGLTTKYAEGLPRPEDIVYAAPYSTAADFCKNACELVTGKVYSREQFKKLALADVRSVLGNDIADAVAYGFQVSPEKMSEVASTFPRADAERLESLMEAAAERPVLAHSKRASFSAKELADLATINRFVRELPEPTTV